MNRIGVIVTVSDDCNEAAAFNSFASYHHDLGFDVIYPVLRGSSPHEPRGLLEPESAPDRDGAGASPLPGGFASRATWRTNLETAIRRAAAEGVEWIVELGVDDRLFFRRQQAREYFDDLLEADRDRVAFSVYEGCVSHDDQASPAAPGRALFKVPLGFLGTWHHLWLKKRFPQRTSFFTTSPSFRMARRTEAWEKDLRTIPSSERLRFALVGAVAKGIAPDMAHRLTFSPNYLAGDQAIVLSRGYASFAQFLSRHRLIDPPTRFFDEFLLAEALSPFDPEDFRRQARRAAFSHERIARKFYREQVSFTEDELTELTKRDYLEEFPFLP